MTPERPAVERRILTALDATPSRIPVLLGPCGGGRTELLRGLAQRPGLAPTQHIDIERAASTPEGFYVAVTGASPFTVPGRNVRSEPPADARAAFDALFAFFRDARSPEGHEALFLIDEVLELRMFESFPGLRGVPRELIDALAASPNRFVLSSRYVNRAHRLLRDAPDRFEVVHVPALSAAEVAQTLGSLGVGRDGQQQRDVARMIHALTDGRPVYVRTLAEALTEMDGASSGDPVSALASSLAVDGHLNLVCRFSYELRLHRARGYGALKAILHVLAEDEPLTLTEIAQRLGRTPGSTKDYLTWLEDVDLVTVRQKRYSYSDPLLRLWVRLHCRTTPPTEADLSREVQEYAVSRLPYMEPTMSESGPGSQSSEAAIRRMAGKGWSIVEID